jgi:hypothetical protein
MVFGLLQFLRSKQESTMNMNPWLVLLVVVGLISGCSATTESRSGRQVVNIPLTASPQNLGQIAQATLVAEGDATEISFFLSGVPMGTTRPVRLYTYIYPGPCNALGAKPAYEMNQTVNTDQIAGDRPGWSLSKKVPVALSELRSKGYAIVVRTSPEDGNLDIFCGLIT